MKNGAIAAGLVLAALGITLAFVPRRVALSGFALTLVFLTATVRLAPASALDAAWPALWLCLVVVAVCTYFPRRFARILPLVAALCGVTAGAVLAGAAGPSRLLAGLSLATYIPASFCVVRGWPVPPRVVISWLLAVALLVGAIPYLVNHPGYIGDHRQ